MKKIYEKPTMSIVKFTSNNNVAAVSAVIHDDAVGKLIDPSSFNK